MKSVSRTCSSTEPNLCDFPLLKQAGLKVALGECADGNLSLIKPNMSQSHIPNRYRSVYRRLGSVSGRIQLTGCTSATFRPSRLLE